jgi:endonuclease/exonuclease/phosphatase family metal-dependent hydrolase
LSNDNIYTRRWYGGIAILWNKSLANNVEKCVDLGNDRICVIKVTLTGSMPVWIIGVYLPQRECAISQFDEYLYQLEYIIERCQSEGNVVIAGDFNCHFGVGIGPRAWGRTTNNANKLKGSIDRQFLSIVDLESTCVGPKYIFHVNGVGTSYIVHCLVSDNLRSNVLLCQILDENILNTSDHLPIRVTLDVNLPKFHYISQHHVHRVAWEKLTDDNIQNSYTVPLEVKLNLIYMSYLTLGMTRH